MKLGVIGLPQSGKSTIFEALTYSPHDPSQKGESRLGTIQVPDERIDFLSRIYLPYKTIHAQIVYFLPGTHVQKEGKEQPIWNQVRDCDALIHVVRNFEGSAFSKPDPESDFRKLDQELIFADLVVVDKRLERVNLEKERGRKIDETEHALLTSCHNLLENETPLRRNPELAQAPELKGFTFLSAKPLLVLFNNGDDDTDLPKDMALTGEEECLAVRGGLEQEIGQMSEDETSEFLKEFGIKETAVDRVIRRSYNLLGIHTFITVGEDEVRAWTIRKGTIAVDAAEAIHTDIKKGFIRAEVLAYKDFVDSGSYAEARKKGIVRLEGKTYIVQDGDMINFRFNV